MHRGALGVACRLNETNTSGTTQNNQQVQVLRKTRSTLSLTPTQGQSELRRAHSSHDPLHPWPLACRTACVLLSQMHLQAHVRVCGVASAGTPVTLHDTTNDCHTPGNQRGGYLQPMGHQHNKHNQKLRLRMSWQDGAIDKRPTMALCCKEQG